MRGSLIDIFTISYLARAVNLFTKKRGGICTRIHALIIGRSSSGSTPPDVLSYSFSPDTTPAPLERRTL